MGTKDFDLHSLSKPGKSVPAKRAAVKPRAVPQKFPEMSPWGKELLKRLDKLHQAMDEEGFKFSQA